MKDAVRKWFQIWGGRFERDRARKQARYSEAYPIDDDFLAALGAMPPSAGIALGFDRLVMLDLFPQTYHMEAVAELKLG